MIEKATRDCAIEAHHAVAWMHSIAGCFQKKRIEKFPNMPKYWKARLEGKDGHYMDLTIEHMKPYMHEELGVEVTSEMQAKAIAMRQNAKMAESKFRDPYKLVSLELIDEK